MVYRKSLLYLTTGVLSSLSLWSLRHQQDDIYWEKLFVSLLTVLAFVANLGLCWDSLSDEWFLVIDALILSSNNVVLVLLFFAVEDLGRMEITLFVSLFNACLLLGFNYLSYYPHISEGSSIPTYNFSSSSMGAADFVYSDDGGLEGEMKDFLIDNFIEGFRVRMDKLPEKKFCQFSGMSPHDEDRTLTWDDFQNAEHLIDSSSCHIYTAMWRNRKVILKLIKADRVNSSVAVSEFETEVSVLSRLNHGNIVRYLGSGFKPRRFIVLEYLEGGTLANVLGMCPDNSRWRNGRRNGRKKFTYLQSLNLVRSLASAMNYLHMKWHGSVSVVHRDLKPDNIGFTSNGILKVFDFGLCACITSDLSNKRAKYAMTGNTGTLRYMAPEVALGEYYNQSVDVYSFGIITWQILKGKIPFEEMNKKTFFEKVVRGRYRPVCDGWWPSDLRHLLESCWHDDFTRRPTFVEVLAMLDDIIEKNKNGSFFLCIPTNIPVTFSNGMFCIDPEFMAKSRFTFLFLPFVMLVVGALCCTHGYSGYGSFLALISMFIMYITVFLSFEYWPSWSLSSLWGKSYRSCGKLIGNMNPFSVLRNPYEALERETGGHGGISSHSTNSAAGSGAGVAMSPMHKGGRKR